MIAIMAIATMLTTSSFSAFAQIDEVDVGFVWDFDDCVESSMAGPVGTIKKLVCTWFGDLPAKATVIRTDDGFDIIIPEEVVTELESETITIDPKEEAKTIIKTEQQIKVEGIMKAKEIVELYGKGELDVDDFCFGGDSQENTIFEQYETIDIKTPYDNIPLGTNIQFKYEHLMSEICKAEYTLEYKIHNALRTFPGEGESYIFVPRTDFKGLLWDELEGLDNPTYAYAEAKMTDFNRDKSEQTAAGFQCSIKGKQQGHCIKSISDQPIPNPTISSEGKEALAKYWILRETGEADIPKQEPGVEISQEALTRQYLESLGWTTSQIDAAIEAMQTQQPQEDE